MMWMIPLHLHVKQKHNDDDDDDQKKKYPKSEKG